jgi:hypothetical protein
MKLARVTTPIKAITAKSAGSLISSNSLTLPPMNQPGANITGAHTSAESTLAVWNRRWSIAIMPSTNGIVHRIGPRKRPKKTAKRP